MGVLLEGEFRAERSPQENGRRQASCSLSAIASYADDKVADVALRPEGALGVYSSCLWLRFATR